jgi:opacity protein-like surface antigen
MSTSSAPSGAVAALAAAAAVLLCAASPAGAQPSQAPPVVTAGQASQATIVRTARPQTMVWSRNPSRVIAALPEGVEMEALSRDAQWLEVLVPERYAGPGGAIGYVFEGHVEAVSGPPVPERPRAQAPYAAPPPREEGDGPRVGFRGYGDLAYQWFRASDSFEAILDRNAGLFFGGGGQVHIGPVFVDVGVQRFSDTGERAFVFDGEVFRLGIPVEITMTPIVVTAGYRFASRDRVVPYLGGGIGSLRFQETSDFSDPDENIDERFTSYHAVAGAEYAIRRWLFVSGEVRYAAVPDALGAPGISAEFDESDLGGFSVAVKVLVGR